MAQLLGWAEGRLLHTPFRNALFRTSLWLAALSRNGPLPGSAVKPEQHCCTQRVGARPQHPTCTRRRIEVIANGLPLWGGAQLAVDTTLSGAARRHKWQCRGAALRIAWRAREHTYPELLRSYRCWLVVLTMEAGGRWSPEAEHLVHCRARALPRPLRPATVPPSLPSPPPGHEPAWPPPRRHCQVDGDQPALSDVLSSTRFEEAPPLEQQPRTWAWRTLTSLKQR